VATQITIPIGPPGQQGEPGPASTVPGPPGPAGEDGFGIQLIGSVADSASLDPAYTGNVGDVFVADDTRNGFAWDGSVWINVGQIRGDDGLSAYQIWLANGNVGTEADFLESLKGADGAPGPPAPRENMAALRARNTVVTDINASTVDNLIPWETTDFSDPLFSRPTDTRIQVDSAGLYYVSGGITATSTVGNSRYNGRVKLRINGSTVEPMRSATGYIRVASGQDETTLTWNYFINLNEGDYFEILVDQENTISAVVNTLPGESYLNVVLLESLAPQISNGQDGLSAYEIWLDNGNSGTEADFLNSLVGPPGTNGTNGTNGTDGRNGEQWFLGSGIPSAGLGEDGDLYLQTDVTAPGDVYEKQSGNWVYQYTLELNGVGPAGDDGNEWTVSNSVPSVGETVGDLHLQTADDSPGVAGDIWHYNGTTWVIVHNIQGTPGAQGERGATWTISTTSPAFVANVNDLHLQTEDDGSGDKGDIWKYNGTVWQPAGNIAGQDAVAWPEGTTFGTTSNTTFTVASGSVYNLSNSGSSQLTVNFNGVNLIDGQSIVINCTKSGTGNILLASTGEGITYEGSTAALYTTSGTKTFIAVKAAGRLYITSSTFLD
ncbi:collagen-like protein, partial [Lewinella sp. W8]|uniref:collagen-like triple helix repeat-containing protein n=1 Tax=Lewinella sp. W8 TaxID=2528208 RepID=UPI0015663DD7